MIPSQAYFVHIPKTAGNTIRQKLRAYGILSNPGYLKSERVHSFGYKNASRKVNSHLSFNSPFFPCYLDDPNFENSVGFTCIRNPYDLLSSYYHHYVDNSKRKNWIDNGWANVNGYHKFKSFYEFIDTYCHCNSEEWHVPPLNRCLYEQIFNSKNESNLDYVIYYEHLNQGIDSIYDLISSNRGLFPSLELKFNYFKENLRNKKLGYKNKSPKVKEKYTSKMIKMVEKKCEWELSTFRYSYNNNSDSIIKDIKNLRR